MCDVRRFSSRWEYTLSAGLALARVQLDVRSADNLDTNVTSALVDLARLVRTNWTADYYAPQVTCFHTHRSSFFCLRQSSKKCLVDKSFIK